MFTEANSTSDGTTPTTMTVTAQSNMSTSTTTDSFYVMTSTGDFVPVNRLIQVSGSRLQPTSMMQQNIAPVV